MTEASGGSRAEVEGRITRRSLEDEDFRRRLFEDPRAVVEEELGTRLSEGVEVRVVEETPDTIYLVLPSSSVVGDEVGELSDRQLESVSGAGWGSIGNPLDPRPC